MVENVSDWFFYVGGALKKVADSAGLTVTTSQKTDIKLQGKLHN